MRCFFFFFNDTATTEIYTLSLHDALPISLIAGMSIAAFPYGTDVVAKLTGIRDFFVTLFFVSRSEEHTSELQSLAYLVCRLLLEKKKKKENESAPISCEHDDVQQESPARL